MDTEASDRAPRSASLFGVAFSVRAGEAFYVPVTDADMEGMSFDLVKARLRKLFAGRTRFVGHNVKFDCVLLRRHGAKPAPSPVNAPARSLPWSAAAARAAR